MKRTMIRAIGVLLAIILVLPAGLDMPAAAYTTSDTLSYGSYPQTKVTDAGLITALNACILEPDNTAAYNGDKYQRVYFTSAVNTQQAANGYNKNTVYWFKFEPVQWRVLSDNNGDLLLMSEKILNTKVYNTPSAAITWETCTLRTWINDSFYNTAFSPEEQVRIKTTDNTNADNISFGTEGGNSTKDKAFLLSYSDLTNTAYGFSADPGVGTNRQAQGSDYSKSQGLMVSSGNSFWWLRSPGQSATYAVAVTALGWAYDNGYETANQNYIGVRPAITVNLSAISYEPGDILEFGSYPQSVVTNQSLIDALNTLTPGGNNNVSYAGAVYKRVYFTQYTANYTTAPADAAHSYQDDNGYFINTVYWFKYEPIRWRVLSLSGGELFLLAEDILTAYPYNLTYNAVTWETSGLRTWLNDTFQSTAFLNTEAQKIKTVSLVNEDNPWQGTEGGNNTQDKLFIPGYTDVTNTAYGFAAGVSPDAARASQGTDYAKCRGLYANVSTGESGWWLRIPGESQYTAGTVGGDGSVWSGEYFTSVHFTGLGIRPAFKINLSSALLTPVAGSGCIINYLKSRIYGLNTGIEDLDGYVNTASGYTLNYVPTANGFGTGSKAKAKLGETVAEVYSILIFGDINGDGNVDSMDAGTAVDFENYLSTWDPVDDAEYYLAGDLNGDGSVDSMDAGIMVDCENYLVEINQGTGLAS